MGRQTQFWAARRAARLLAVVGLSVFGGGGGTVWGQEGSPFADLQAVQGKQEAVRTAGEFGGATTTADGLLPLRPRVVSLGMVKPAAGQQPSQQAGGIPQTQEEATKSPTAPCVEPPPMVRWQDYEGPLKKIVGAFAGRLERKSTHPPHYKPGAVLCSFAPKDKFILFVQDMIDPVTFLGVGFDAGIDQAQNSDPTFGQGAAGYGKRFGADFAGQASSTFFKDFAFPSLFSEDPRYYRLAHGSGGKRLFHAMRHAVVAHRDNGRRMFNFSEWLGTVSAVALSNTFHPGNERGFGPAAQRVGISVLTDAGFDVLREFWPEISRKCKLPFRGAQETDPEVRPNTK